MLQRVQTIYMLASVIAITMMCFLSLATFQIPEATVELSALGLTSISPEVALDDMRLVQLCLIMIMLIVPLVAIFCYKKHNYQMHLLIYASIVNLLYYGYFFLLELDFCKSIVAAQSASHSDVISSVGILAALMPALSLFCNVMAIKGVIKDKLLLASLNRLR